MNKNFFPAGNKSLVNNKTGAKQNQKCINIAALTLII